jgi:hypothetical protein
MVGNAENGKRPTQKGIAILKSIVDEKTQRLVKLTHLGAITVWIHCCSSAVSNLSGQGEPEGDEEVP